MDGKNEIYRARMEGSIGIIHGLVQRPGEGQLFPEIGTE